MEQESTLQDAPTVTAIQNGAGLWLLQDTSGRVSKELFVSLKIATKAMEEDLYTWDETQ